MKQATSRSISRRAFLGTAATAALTATVVPSRVWGKNAPSNKLNIATIGAGGRGRANLLGIAKENVVALCDVDQVRAANMINKNPQAKLYRDFRVMLDEMAGDIDAVVVSTPDHTHYVAAMAAIERGKHVYCEKPIMSTTAGRSPKWSCSASSPCRYPTPGSRGTVRVCSSPTATGPMHSSNRPTVTAGRCSPFGRTHRSHVMSMTKPGPIHGLCACVWICLLMRPMWVSAGEPNQLTQEEKSEGFTLLFDGKSIEQWRNYKPAVRIESQPEGKVV